VQIAGFVNEPPHGAARTAILRPTGRIRPQSPSGNTHVSGESGPGTASIDNEIVPPRLVIDRASDGGLEDSVFRRGAQGSSEVYGIVLPQAHIERSGACDPDAIAGFAKIMRQGGNESDAAPGFSNACVSRRSTGAVVDIVQRVALREPGANDRKRKIL
jgi:hypothetical protein